MVENNLVFSNSAQEIKFGNCTTLGYAALLNQILSDRWVDNYVPNLKKLDEANLEIYIRDWC